MNGVTALQSTAEVHPITYLSSAMPVNMGDWWFDIANSRHFWIKRRFKVLRKLADALVRTSVRTAEIGCGNGLLQRELEDSYGKSVVGFELNELALKRNASRQSPLYCYDIHQRDENFRAAFDLVFLFDVLEHVDDESAFLQSVKFHMATSGSLLINVPAHQWLYSDYDRAAGHVRRYSIKQLACVAEKNGLKMRSCTYWGLPLLPLLLIRKAIHLDRADGRAGFDSRGRLINSSLSFLARIELLPQTLMGTSVMAVFENRA